MQFSDFAAKETSSLLARITAGSAETSRQHLHAFRSAIDAAAKALEDAGHDGPDIEAEVADLVGRLTKAAVAAAEAAAQRVAAESKAATDALRDELTAESKEKERILVEIGMLAADRDRIGSEREALASERQHLAAEIDRLGAERHGLASDKTNLEAEKAHLLEENHALGAERDRLSAALSETKNHADGARMELEAYLQNEAAARNAADAERRELHAEIERVHAEAAEMRKRLDAVGADKARQDDALGEAQTQLEAAEAKLAAVSALFKTSSARVKALEHAEQEHEQAMMELEARVLASASAAATVVESGRPSVSLLDDLLGGFQALSSASTIPDIVTTFMEQVAAEFPRVALFRVKGNRLQGEHHIGFDLKTDIAKVALPLGMDSLLTRAASTGRIERLTGADLTDSSRTPFGGTPSCALALPIVVNGDTLGIVYADDSGQPASGTAAHELRSRIAEALLQHAVALLMRLTTELKNLAELRAYATSLLSEIEQMYVSDVKGGKSGDDLQNRLKSNVEYARSIYANRVAFECPDAAPLLDDQIVEAVEAHGSMGFGRDLGAVARLAGLALAHPRSAAEAS